MQSKGDGSTLGARGTKDSNDAGRHFLWTGVGIGILTDLFFQRSSGLNTCMNGDVSGSTNPRPLTDAVSLGR